jgi:hypothetical protein
MKKTILYVSVLLGFIAVFSSLHMVLTGQLYADQIEPKKDCWCCMDGEVRYVPSDTPCSEMGRGCFEKREDAEKFCQEFNKAKDKIQNIKDNVQDFSKENRVWCCVDGELHYVPEEQCKQISEIYSERREEAKEKCGKGGGWCCSDGKLVFTTMERCKEKKNGTFYETLNQALSECKGFSAAMLCYCCKNGRYKETTVKDCLAKRGYPFLTEAMAKEFCIKPIIPEREDTKIPADKNK